MRSAIAFGPECLSIRLPENTRFIKPPELLPSVSDLRAKIHTAIEKPYGHRPLWELVGPGARVTIAFDDCAIPPRPMREDFRKVALETVIQILLNSGVRLADIKLICANGLHRKWTRRELATILGEEIALKTPHSHLYCHDAEDRENLLYLGQTERGVEVEIAREVIEPDQFIYLNVTPTPMNGGWKSVVVGLSSFRSIRHHHRPYPSRGFSLMDPERSSFHKILWEMGELLQRRLATADKKIFTIESAISNADPPYVIDVVAGHPPDAHAQLLPTVQKQLVTEIKGQTDALLLGLPDASPYAKHSFTNPIIAFNLGLEYGFRLYQNRPAVRQGGILILAHPFTEQFDEIHHAPYIEFYERCLRYSKDPFELWDLFCEDFAHRYIHKYRYGYSFHGSHPFFLWNATLWPKEYLSEIWLAGAKREVAECLGFRAFANVRRALHAARRQLGKSYSLTVWAGERLGIARVI